MKKLLALTVFVFVSIFTFASPAKATSCAITSESISPSSAALSAGSTGVTWTVSASCQSPYIHNTANALGYLCNGGSCVAATATPVRNSYTYTFSFLLNQSSPAGVWTPRMTLSSSDGVTKFDIGSNSSVVISAYVAPTTTTVAPTTTTIPHPSFNVCWSGWTNSYGQNDGWMLVEVYYSTSLNAYKYPNLSRPNVPVPSGGCSSLNPVAPTSTTAVPVTTIPTTTTTTVYNPRITYCQATILGYVNSIPQWNYANWQQGNETISSYNSSVLLYPNSYRYPVPAGGCSSLNTIQTTTTTSAPVVQQKTQVAPTQVAILPKVQPPVITSPVIQSPVITSPVIQSPVITLPKTINPGVSAAIPAKVPYVVPWKYVWMNKTSTKQIRTGALCYSGKTSTATGSGACSHNGGVKNWIYFNKTSTSKVKYKCWLNQNTNTYNKNCIAV